MFLKYIKRNLLGALVVSLVATVALAYATTGAVFDIVNRAYFVATSGHKMTIGTAGSDTFNLIAAGTPVAAVDSAGLTFYSGKGVTNSAYIATVAATPVSGTNDIKKGFNYIGTGCTASDAAGLPLVPVAGDEFEGFNQCANAIRIKAFGTPGINGGAAGTYFPVATMTYFKCTARSATAYTCGTLAVPTPAGP